jgi:hypothetical protein
VRKIGALATSSVKVRVAVAPSGSVAWTVKVKVPPVVGMPSRMPAGLSETPAGRLPVVTIVTTGWPSGSVAPSVWERAWPAMAGGRSAGVAKTGAALRRTWAVAARPSGSWARTMKVAPAPVGVPARVPSEASVTPSGSAPLSSDQVKASPSGSLPTREMETGLPTTRGDGRSPVETKAGGRLTTSAIWPLP